MTENKRFIIIQDGDNIENKRFTIIQDGNNFTVRDNLKGVPMGMFEFKENEFPVFACFCRIIDLLNELNDENQQFREALKELKEIGDYQAMRIQELDNENDELSDENEQLKQDVDYWNQVANQEHRKKYKTACKNIYYRRNDNND